MLQQIKCNSVTNGMGQIQSDKFNMINSICKMHYGKWNLTNIMGQMKYGKYVTMVIKMKSDKYNV